MKQLTSFCLFLFFISTNIYPQDQCIDGPSLVSGYSVSTVTGTNAMSGPYYGCASNGGNNVGWLSITACQSGIIEIWVNFQHQDFDYALWGPFSIITCDSLDSLHLVDCQQAFWGNTISFNANAGETYFLCARSSAPGAFIFSHGNYGFPGSGVADACNATCGQFYDAENVCFVSVDISLNKHKIFYPSINNGAIDEIQLLSSINWSVYDTLSTWNSLQAGSFINTNFPADQQGILYTLQTKDTCGNVIRSVHTITGVFLSSNTSGNNNLLSWTGMNWVGVQKYYILRGTNLSNLSIIDSVSSDTLDYTDINPGSSNFYYVIAGKLASVSCSNNFSDSLFYSNSSNPGLIGVSESELEDELQIYPNPNEGIFTLNLKSLYQGEITLIVCDLSGRVVASDSFIKNNDSILRELNFGILSSGVYYLKVQIGDRILARKIIRQ